MIEEKGLGRLPDGIGLSPTAEPLRVSSPVGASIPSAFADHRLCYVSGSWAYFTNAPLDKQWGDDWDDAPYEHNAGDPYESEAGQIIKLAWDGPFQEPSSYHSHNSPWSVEQINAGAMAWLTPSWSGIKVSVRAGATVREFVAILHSVKGEVFFPASAIEAGTAETGTGSVHESAVAASETP